MDASLEWKIVVDRRFTSGHRTIGGQHERTKMDFMRSRNIEEDMAEDRHLWRLGVDRRLLAIKILIINK